MDEHIGSRGMAYALELVKRCDDIALDYNAGAYTDAYNRTSELVKYIGRNDPMPALGVLSSAITDAIGELRDASHYAKISAVQVLKIVADKVSTHRVHEALMAANGWGELI